jgi:hypothetical protein
MAFINLTSFCSVVSNIYVPTAVDQNTIVAIATRYGMDGPRIESWWRRDFPQQSRPDREHIQSSVQWVQGLFLGNKAAE